MRGLLAALALGLAALPAFATTILEEPMPAWLAGAWDQSEGTEWSDEFWTPPRAGLMIGASRMGKGGALTVFEHTRIVRKPDGSLSFFAQPRGVPASEFPMVGSGADWIEFANPAHDYPQRIKYWREGPLLKARISLMDGGNAYEWTFKPMGSPE
jgi:Domain of unknown function (DUF6265)